MRRIIRITFTLVALVISLSMKAQSFVKYERFVDDGHVWHNCIHALETSDGNIVMMEECCDTIKDFSGVYTESVNLLKINPQGMLIDSTKVSFSATSLDSPFLRNPFESNSNVMSGIYKNDNNEIYYTAVFFDNNLSVTNTIDIPFLVEGFMTSYKSLIDNNGDIILVSKEDGTENTYIFVKMNVYGEIKTVQYSVSENYTGLYMAENPLYIHRNDPLEYGCYFLDGVSNRAIMTIILDDNFEILNFVEIDEFIVENRPCQFDCSESEMIYLKDGNILMSSIVYDTQGVNVEIGEHLQLTKFNKEYDVVDYERIAFRPMNSNGNHFHVNMCKSILEDNYGNIYLIWINAESGYVISFLNTELDLIWECTFINPSGGEVVQLYDAFITENNTLVIWGDYIKFDIGYYGVCYIVNNEHISTEECNYSRPYSFYPNPADSEIRISFSQDVNCEKVEIYGIDGKLYHEQNFNFNSIDISSLSNGIYMMKVTLNNGNTYTEKVVVK